MLWPQADEFIVRRDCASDVVHQTGLVTCYSVEHSCHSKYFGNDSRNNCRNNSDRTYDVHERLHAACRGDTGRGVEASAQKLGEPRWPNGGRMPVPPLHYGQRCFCNRENIPRLHMWLHVLLDDRDRVVPVVKQVRGDGKRFARRVSRATSGNAFRFKRCIGELQGQGDVLAVLGDAVRSVALIPDLQTARSDLLHAIATPTGQLACTCRSDGDGNIHECPPATLDDVSAPVTILSGMTVWGRVTV
mmetsp:Transcript_14700/g.37208  ORF Transcript_14700/g.37208 Transcript_14700/m.37208 type:complete len:246 (-) Transcript_14700:478-1215(-)